MFERAEEAAAKRLERFDWAFGPGQVERELARVKRRIRRRRITRAAFGAAASVGVLVVGLVALRSHLPVASQPRASTSRTPSSSSSSPSPSSATMTLDDGSIIRPGPGARVIAREIAAHRVRVALEMGGAAFDIVHRPERELTVEVGAVHVRVLGTQFSVDRVGARAHVHVLHGHVRVAWAIPGRPGRPEDEQRRDLFTGDDGTFPDSDGNSDDGHDRESDGDGYDDAAAAAGIDDAVSDRPAELNRRSDRPAAAQTAEAKHERWHAARGAAGGASRGWRRLARAGGYREAYDLMVAGGPQSVRDDVDDLLLASDAARLSGHPARALPYLDRVVDRHAPDDRAPMAAFTRGRIFMTLGRSGDAAASFERALDLGARGSLHENALARAVEAHSKAGNGARAAGLARTYVARYPAGRWRNAVRTYGGLD